VIKSKRALLLLLILVFADCGPPPAPSASAAGTACEPAALVSGCGIGPIRTEADAVAAARLISHLSEPVAILLVEQGRAGDIFSGPLGAVPNDQIAAETARRQRPAWRVDIRGLVTEPCADSAALLPCGLATIQLVFDRDTGAVLYLVYPG